MTKNLFRFLLCFLLLAGAIFGTPPANEDANQHRFGAKNFFKLSEATQS